MLEQLLLSLTVFFGIFENFMASLGQALPFGYAFGAGMVASVNPCGFLMLPAFGSYYLGAEEPGFEALPAWERGLRALLLGLTATLGFVVLFGVVGLVLALFGRGLVAVFPYGGLLIGVALLGLGVWLLFSGHSFGILAASRVQAPFGRGAVNVFLFGIAYGISSLACTLPIFLTVVGTALASGGLLGGLSQFVIYGLGMGVILTAVTMGAAFFKQAVATRLRSLLPLVHRLGAFFLLGAGVYVILFWVYLGGVFSR